MNLKLIRKIGGRIEVVLTLCAVLLFASCTKTKSKPLANTTNAINATVDSNESTGNASARNLQYSDVDVFKGVMFMTGPISEAFLKDFSDFGITKMTDNQQDIAEVLAFQSQIIDNLVNADPLYLSKFRTAIGSGDLKIVESTITNAANDVLHALIAIENESPNNGFIHGKVTSFMASNHLTSTSSLQDFKDALNRQVDDVGGPKSVKLKIYAYGWVWLVVAAAAVIVIMLLAATDATSQNNFYFEDFVTTVTLDMNDI